MRPVHPSERVMGEQWLTINANCGRPAEHLV
jgi:hypothetical protein